MQTGADDCQRKQTEGIGAALKEKEWEPKEEEEKKKNKPKQDQIYRCLFNTVV